MKIVLNQPEIDKITTLLNEMPIKTMETVREIFLVLNSAIQKEEVKEEKKNELAKS